MEKRHQELITSMLSAQTEAAEKEPKKGWSTDRGVRGFTKLENEYSNLILRTLRNAEVNGHQVAACIIRKLERRSQKK